MAERSTFYAASDYAGIALGKFRFYYGYEVTTPSGEWCFVARVPGSSDVSAEYPASQLGGNKWDCVEMLMRGLELFFEESGLADG